MNAVMPCTHSNLHVEQRMVTLKVNVKPSSANFIVCSNQNCRAVIAYVPPRTKAAPKPKTANLQPTVNALQIKIKDLEAQLMKCRNGQG